MNWRYLIFLPVAAVCVGDPASAPKLRTEIPKETPADCPYAEARKQFYLAYAYRKEKPEVAKYFCGNTLTYVQKCGAEADSLRARITDLCNIPVTQ